MTWTRRIFWLLLVAAVVGGVAYLWNAQHITEDELRAWAAQAHPGLVFALVFLLPLLGFPISITLVLVGIRFGFAGGMAVVAAVVLGQLLIGLPLGRGPLHGLAKKLFGARIDALARAGWQHQAVVTFLTTLIPGPPYIGKVYGLAAARVPAVLYLGIGWPVYVVTSIPLVGLGGSAMHLSTERLLLFGGLAVGLALALHWARRRWGQRTVGPEA